MIVRALREIKHYQKSVDPLIPFLPFSRLVREIADELVPPHIRQDLKFQKSALIGLRYMAEERLVCWFERL
jgi:histone H3/H4